MLLYALLQGFPLPSPNHFRVSHLPTSSPTLLPSCLSPTMDTSLLLSAALPAAVWMPAQQWKLEPVCWRAVHCGIWAMVPDRWDSELTCLQDPQGTSQAPATQVDTQSNPECIFQTYCCHTITDSNCIYCCYQWSLVYVLNLKPTRKEKDHGLWTKGSCGKAMIPYMVLLCHKIVVFNSSSSIVFSL